MKRFVIALSFMCVSLTALLLVVSCSNQANPTFVGPLQTVSQLNPTLTPTDTNTPTSTPTPAPAFPVVGFNGPYALAIDSTGKEYVGDTGNNFVNQFINGVQNTLWPSGKTKSNGISYVSPKAIAADASGNIYVVGNGSAVSKYDTNGNYVTQYTTVSGLSGPLGVACSGTTLYVSDTGNKQIVRFSLPSGSATTIISGSFSPYGLAVDSSGTTIFIAGSDSLIYLYSSGGTLILTIPGFSTPYAVAVDSNNNLYVSDTGNHQVEKISPVGPNGKYSGSPITIYGQGSLSSPEGIALDSSNNIYVVDSGNNEFFQFVP